MAGSTPREYEFEKLSSGREGVSRVGQKVGNYVILREIGKGSMGTIYLAQHGSLDRMVAIKFLGDHLSHDPSYVEIFLREAKAASKLSDPGIVALFDAGSIDDHTHYQITEYVEGRDLFTILRDEGAQDVEHAVDYVCQAAKALDHAHREGFVHRDIKPENLLLTPQGKIKICDLGLAKRVGESSMITQKGVILGSPNYIAPERLSGDPNLDARCDIYSLGATCFHLLTGKIPYEGTPPVIMSKHLAAPVPALRSLNPEIPEALCAVIRKMMAKEPKDRYQTMQDVIDALQPFARR